MRPPRGTTTRRWSSRPGTPPRTTLTGPARSAARAPRRRGELLVQRLALPGDQDAARAPRAAGPAPRARPGSPPRAPSPPATPRGRAGRGPGPPSAPASAATRRPRPVASTTVCRKRTFLPTESTSSARSGAEGRGERQAREAAARRRCPAAASMPSAAQRRHGGQAVEDVEAGDVGRLADRRQVDRLGPGEQEAHVGVDRGAGGRLQREAERDEPGVERLVVRRGQRRRGPRTRVGSGSLGRSRAPSMWSCTSPSGSRSRRRTFAAAGVWSVSRHPVGSGPGLPVTPRGRRAPSAHAACGERTVGSRPAGRQDGLSTIRAAPSVRCG